MQPGLGTTIKRRPERHHPEESQMASPRTRFTVRRLAAAVALLSLGAGATPPVLAQSSSAEGIEEVVVTARKREETLQDVPVAVSAITGDQIRNAYAQSAKDLEGMSPNLIYDRVQATPGGAGISIRGVSFQDVEKSFDPAVGVVVDGIYLGTNTGAMLQVFDMERIEVLRGPQGTLFGKNTIGGIINVIRSKPTGEWDARVRVRGGSNDRQEYEGVVMFPILKDTLAGKITYADRQEDGWSDNVFTGDTAGDFEYTQYGAALRYTPTEDLTIDYAYDRQEDDSRAAALLGQNQPGDLFCLPLDIITGDPYVPPGQCAQGDKPLTGDYFEVSQNGSDYAFMNTDAHTLSLNWAIGDGWALDYLYGYRQSNERMDQDFDASPAQQFETRRDQDYEQSSHELRVSYDSDSRFRAVAGAYQWHSEYQLGQQTFHLFNILAAVNPALAALAPTRPITQFQATDHSNDSWAVFTEMDYDITDTLTLTAGGRYTTEEKEMSRAQALQLGAIPLSLVPLLPPALGLSTEFIGGSGVYPKPEAAISMLFSTYGAEPDEDWDQFTPKLGIRWEPSDEQMVYLTWSSGFRSGGFNGRAGALTTAQISFDEETVESFELGWKASWLENRVQTNVALFTGAYDDKQEEIVVPLPTGDQETITQNASEADISGAEFELQAMLTDAWTVRANLGYLDASYDDFCADVDGPNDPVTNPAPPTPLPNECGPRQTTSGGVIIPTDNSDLELRRAPELSWSVDSSYVMKVGPGDLTLQASWRWKDDYYTTFQNVPLGFTESFGLLDASIAWEYCNWRFAVFGRNLTDEEYISSALLVAGLFNFQAIGQDRTVGAELSYHFGD
jgi:iron complex outermembrane receptor protein